MLWSPAPRLEVVKVAVVTPAVVETLATPTCVLPSSSNVTVPLGFADAVCDGETVAVKVTAWP